LPNSFGRIISKYIPISSQITESIASIMRPSFIEKFSYSVEIVSGVSPKPVVSN